MASNVVLVSGGAGYIGSHVCKALASSGFTPVVLDNLSMGHEWAVRWGPFVRADIADREAVFSIVRNHSPIGVIHLAAKAYVGESVKDPKQYYDSNVRQLLTFLETLRETGLRNVVFSSSCSVYGTPICSPVTETLPLDPASPYAQTKVFGEWAVKAYGTAYGFNYAILRYFNAAGADADREIGEDHEPETHLIPNAIRAALRGKSLQVFGSDYNTADGTCIRDYVHVSDLADAHVLALRCIQQGRSVTVNLGSGKGNSVLEVARAVERVSGQEVKLRWMPRRGGDAEALYASWSLAREELGWEPSYREIDEIVLTAWRWTKEHWRA